MVLFRTLKAREEEMLQKFYLNVDDFTSDIIDMIGKTLRAMKVIEIEYVLPERDTQDRILSKGGYLNGMD
jgi:hypothetical protein